MEGKREVVEDFLVGRFIVLGHCIKESFLVSDYEIEGEMILHSDYF